MAMNKNEYRRALIMMRPQASGYAGHVRLERRVMMGSLDFVVSAPQGEDALEAALAGQRGGEYYAASLGSLRRDRRGQAALAWSFDPRNVEGRPLEAYSLAVVARTGAESCEIVLTGNVEGARPLDLSKVREAVCGRLRAEEAPAADLPEPGEEPSEEPSEPSVEQTTPGATGLTPEQAAAETRIFTRSRPARTAQADGAVSSEAKDKPPQPAAEAPSGADGAGAQANASPDLTAEEAAVQAADPAAVSGVRNAAEALGVDAGSPWTGALEPLRALFAAGIPVDTLEDGFVYVCAPLEAGGDGTCRTAGECRIGLRATEGRVDALRYAVPALYTPEPPEGLEAYAWAGNDTHGYWVLTADPQTGAPM